MNLLTKYAVTTKGDFSVLLDQDNLFLYAVTSDQALIKIDQSSEGSLDILNIYEHNLLFCTFLDPETLILVTDNCVFKTSLKDPSKLEEIRKFDSEIKKVNKYDRNLIFLTDK